MVSMNKRGCLSFLFVCLLLDASSVTALRCLQGLHVFRNGVDVSDMNNSSSPAVSFECPEPTDICHRFEIRQKFDFISSSKLRLILIQSTAHVYCL